MEAYTWLTVLVLISMIPLSLSMASDDQVQKTEGFHNESEAGIVITGGNSDAQSYNLKQENTLGWDINLVKFYSKFLETTSKGQETAQRWTLGLRYERKLNNRFSIFLGQNIESDPFAGYFQRYNTDIGGKYFLITGLHFFWDVELGYRYAIENRRSGQVNQNYIRLYTEADRNWTKTISSKVWFEYLPNLTVTTDYQFNSEISVSAAFNDIFSLKTAYLINYRHILISPATANMDTQFSTALISKF